MSVDAQFIGGLERPTVTRLTTTDLTTVVTGRDNTRIVAEMAITNEVSSNRRADIYYYDGTTNYYIGEVQVSGNSYEKYDIPVRLYEGDEIRVQADGANAISIYPVIIITSPFDKAHEHWARD